jgi:hypothetical protein
VKNFSNKAKPSLAAERLLASRSSLNSPIDFRLVRDLPGEFLPGGTACSG